MLLTGVDYLAGLVEGGGFSAKMVFNGRGAIIFPVAAEHRDQTAAGISYKDNYEGNALAAMLTPGKIEIRYHNSFTDTAVTRIVTALLAQPELAFMKTWQVVYQGRRIVIK